MQAELVHAAEPTSWHGPGGKQVLIVFPLPVDRRRQLSVGCLAAAAALAVAGTSISYRLPVVDLDLVGTPMSVAAAAREEETLPSVPVMLQTVRKRAALTWEQLARIFDVSRRAVHHWAGGNSLSPENQLRVRNLFDEAIALGDVEPFVARSRLLHRHGIEAAPVDRRSRSEPILVADQSPLAANAVVRRTPMTRVRRG